jgi:hypothetical protein
VVSVFAEGHEGRFRIAYGLATPVNMLKDVDDFVAYEGRIVAPDDVDDIKKSCIDMGSKTADRGRFAITFDASSVVRESMNLSDPLNGPVWISIYREEDVTLTGPRPGTEALADLHFPLVDVSNVPTLQQYETEVELPAGKYQVLGFMDIDDNVDLAGNNQLPDRGDPVIIPVGGYELTCARHPIVVEFALLNPTDTETPP